MTNFQTMKMLLAFQLLKQKHHSNQYGLNRKQKAFRNLPISSWLSNSSHKQKQFYQLVFSQYRNLDKLVKKVGHIFC